LQSPSLLLALGGPPKTLWTICGTQATEGLQTREALLQLLYLGKPDDGSAIPLRQGGASFIA
jgi:hypothetical protein